jgi:uncharacterized protein YndB with AHSA1/START domain
MAELNKSIWIDAPPEVVFEYFTNPQKMELWCGKSAQLDPVPGGIYRVDMGSWGIVEGEFVRVEAPNFVSHTVPSGSGEESPPGLIEITITPDAGGSRVEIRQTGLQKPIDLIAARGWDHHLARLSVAATGGAAGADSMCSRTATSFEPS